MRIKLLRNGVARKSVQVADGASVLDLKEAISCQEKVPIFEQNLTFDGLLLEDDKRLSEYDLHDNCQVNLFLRLGFQPPFSVFILFPGRRRLRMDVQAAQTVSDLKKDIEEKENMQLDNVGLIYDHWVLEDAKTLAEYDISAGAEIILAQELKAESALKLRDPTPKIAPIPADPAGVVLVKNGKYHTFYDAENDAHDSDRITLTFLTKNRFPVTMKVRPDVSIGEVRGKLAQILRMPANKVWFLRNGKSLDLSKSFAHYDIASGESVLLMSPEAAKDKDDNQRRWYSIVEEVDEPKIRIIVQTRSGQTFACHVRPKTKIGVLKKHLESEIGISRTSMGLYHRRQLMDEDLTIKDYELTCGSLIHLRH